MLALLMTACLFSACAKKEDDDSDTGKKEKTVTTAPKDEDLTGNDGSDPEEVTEPVEEHREITGETVQYGKYSVLVPEGYELKEPGEFSYYDFSVQKSDFSFFYFITEDDDELMMTKYNYNKQTYTNEQEDVSGVYGENEWTGFQYSDGFGGYGFEAYTTVDGKIVRISSAGFRFDSDEAQAILSSFRAG